MIWLKQLIEENSSRTSRYFALFIQCLVVLSLVTYSIETIPELSNETTDWLRIIEIITVAIFTFEYIARVVVADKKRTFILSAAGFIDLFAILPFYLSMGIDLRSIRLLRILRLFRIFKFVRYSTALRRFQRAFMIAREELILFLIVTVILLYFSAIGIYHFEHDAQPKEFSSVFSSLWWAVVTLTTVGYGDIYPVTVGGRIFTFGVLMVGLGIVAVPAGLVSSALSKAREIERALHEEDENLDEFRDQKESSLDYLYRL